MKVDMQDILEFVPLQSLYNRVCTLSLCWYMFIGMPPTQLGITCAKLAIETLEQGVKYVQS